MANGRSKGITGGLCYNLDSRFGESDVTISSGEILSVSIEQSPIPPGYTFSQSSLQAYADCPRRFWLTYIRQLPWPAVEATPVQAHEQLMRLGQEFHRLVQRAEIGMDPDLLAARLRDPLDLWFSGYRHHRPTDLPTGHIELEYSTRIPLDVGSTERKDAPDVFLTALFDLLAVDARSRAVIIDWKTSRQRPQIATVQRRLQSRVYPYVLVEASKHMPWGPLEPEQVEMRYWYTAAPDLPISLPYDRRQHAENERDLRQLIASILRGSEEADFPKVEDTESNRMRYCRFCAYRSRCDRGAVPGPLQEFADFDDSALDDLDDLIFDLSDIQELAF